MKKTISLIIIGLIAVRCKDDSNAKLVSITQTSAGMEVSNRTTETLYYFAVDQNELAVILWAPGINSETSRIEPTSSETIPFGDVFGYTDETEVIVFHYWNAVTEAGEVQAGPISTIEVHL